MNTPEPKAQKWLSDLMVRNAGRVLSNNVYALGRRAGFSTKDICDARRALRVEMWGIYWQLPAAPAAAA